MRLCVKKVFFNKVLLHLMSVGVGLGICSIGAILWGTKSAAQAEHEFVGVNKCALCHKKVEQGEQFKIWQESKHAMAYETLWTPEAREQAAKLGINDPQTSGKCLKCHSTAYWFSEIKVTEEIPVEEGISCESCHGPGKDYMKKTIMEKREEAIANGLIMPDENTCRKCHNPEAPTYKSFDFKERWEKIKHPLPK